MHWCYCSRNGIDDMNDLAIGDQRSSTTGQTKKPLLD